MKEKVLAAEGPVRVVGTMSGTSLDGVDAAELVTDGVGITAFGATAYRAYDPAERAVLRAALGRWPGEDGVASPKIIGPALDGNGYASIPDTGGGAHDGDTKWDRAVWPMQFIPGTWKLHGADGNGDGAKDPHNIDDASLAAARYLCARGGMDSAGGWRSAVIGYNRSEQYLADVARVANTYAQKVSG